MKVPRSAVFLLGLLMACCAAIPAAGAASVARFAAEDWPPFMVRASADDGLSGSLVHAVFEHMGETAQIEYFPWKRTMQFGLSNPAYAGFMAVWRTAEREKLCHFSSSIGSTLTVLAFLKDAPLRPASLAELRGMKIGTVAGFANGEQFDAMAARGELWTEEGVNDEINLKKLLIGRFRAIVIEKHVLRNLLLGPRFSAAERERIGIAANLFKERSVHICFKRNAQGLALQRRFNAAARAVDTAKLEKAYWKRLGGDNPAAAPEF